MGTDKHNSVVDPDGMSWNVQNLYVADASTFPTPSVVHAVVIGLLLWLCWIGCQPHDHNTGYFSHDFATYQSQLCEK